MTQYGFLGLGIMGEPMATNLVKAGFEVTVWNRTAEKCAPLIALGARQGKTPCEVVARCDITFAMLADPDAARQVCLRAGRGTGRHRRRARLCRHVHGGRRHLPRHYRRRSRQRGGRFLEAPVSGTKKPAEDGTLIILAAGDRSLYEEAAPPST